jgi:hypothetical protein
MLDVMDSAAHPRSRTLPLMRLLCVAAFIGAFLALPRHGTMPMADDGTVAAGELAAAPGYYPDGARRAEAGAAGVAVPIVRAGRTPDDEARRLSTLRAPVGAERMRTLARRTGSPSPDGNGSGLQNAGAFAFHTNTPPPTSPS